MTKQSTQNTTNTNIKFKYSIENLRGRINPLTPLVPTSLLLLPIFTPIAVTFSATLLQYNL